ncbi:MAG: tetratricopeptide repeat protein [Nitrospinota bacterium]
MVIHQNNKLTGFDIRVLILTFLLIPVLTHDLYAFKFPGLGGKGSEKAQNLYRNARGAYGSADYSKAIDLTTKAIKENPKFAKAYALRGKANKDLGDVDKAFKDLNRAIELDSNLGEAYFIRAQTHEIMGDMDKAKADYKKGCKAGYKSACN